MVPSGLGRILMHNRLTPNLTALTQEVLTNIRHTQSTLLLQPFCFTHGSVAGSPHDVHSRLK